MDIGRANDLEAGNQPSGDAASFRRGEQRYFVTGASGLIGSELVPVPISGPSRLVTTARSESNRVDHYR
jgi:hypothetical protein